MGLRHSVLWTLLREQKKISWLIIIMRVTTPGVPRNREEGQRGRACGNFDACDLTTKPGSHMPCSVEMYRFGGDPDRWPTICALRTRTNSSRRWRKSAVKLVDGLAAIQVMWLRTGPATQVENRTISFVLSRPQCAARKWKSRKENSWQKPLRQIKEKRTRKERCSV